MSSPEPTDEELERFARALRNAEENQRIFIPPTVDEAILRQARERFGGQKSRRPFRFWNWLAVAGASALIAIVILIFPRSKNPNLVREDINGDGTVDILDAFALAKSIEASQPNAKFDQNNDGKLDEADIRAVASAAVRLDRKS